VWDARISGMEPVFYAMMKFKPDIGWGEFRKQLEEFTECGLAKGGYDGMGTEPFVVVIIGGGANDTSWVMCFLAFCPINSVCT